MSKLLRTHLSIDVAYSDVYSQVSVSAFRKKGMSPRLQVKMVMDEVVHKFPDLSRYRVDAKEEVDFTAEKYIFLLAFLRVDALF